ncbi:MAG: hypothetical protein PHE53_02000 [Thermoguttaceae bacterium]|nr:hypothetical protein [Thermoguttaceae bacterium]
MIQELVYTSAPRGLQPGKSGFCTVACTQGMTPNLFTMLESMSGYRHLSTVGEASPIVYSYHPVSIGGRVWQVLSRISAYGLDYTQRANKLADHWVLDPSDSVGRNAAWLLQPRQNLLRSEWNGDPRWLLNPGPLPTQSPSTEEEVKRCPCWKMVTGDVGWAGVLCENAMLNRETTIIIPPLFDILTLFEEALSLIPSVMRWQVSFSTYLTRLPPGVPCLWKGVVDGTPEAATAREHATSSASLVDLCQPLPPLSATGLEQSAYVQRARLMGVPRAQVATPQAVSPTAGVPGVSTPWTTSAQGDADVQTFSNPITAGPGASSSGLAESGSMLRDGSCPRLDSSFFPGECYDEQIPQRPNPVAMACSPATYAQSRERIFGNAPELPAVAKAKKHREHWIVGLLLAGFMLGMLGGGAWGVWWFWFRPQEGDTTQAPTNAAVSNEPSEKSAVSEKLPKSEPAKSEAAAENAESQDQKNPEMLQAQKQEDVKLGDGASSTSVPELKDGSTDDARPKEDNSDSKGGDKDSDGSSTATSPTDQNITKASMASEGSDSREVKEKSSESLDKPTEETLAGGETAGNAELPELSVCFDSGDPSAKRIEPRGRKPVTLEEGYTGRSQICKLWKVTKQKPTEEGKQPIVSETEELLSSGSVDNPSFEIESGYLYAKQPFDYETMKGKGKEMTISLCGIPLKIVVKDKKYSPGDNVKLNLTNVTIRANPDTNKDDPPIVQIEDNDKKVWFSEPVYENENNKVPTFPKLTVEGSTRETWTWKCDKYWPKEGLVDITFKCTEGVLEISSTVPHSFTFEADGILMDNTTLHPVGFETIKLKVNGNEGDMITVKGLAANTTIESNSGKETVVIKDETFKLDGTGDKDKEECFGHELTIEGKK